jgi:hypothetical protein
MANQTQNPDQKPQKGQQDQGGKQKPQQSGAASHGQQNGNKGQKK